MKLVPTRVSPFVPKLVRILFQSCDGKGRGNSLMRKKKILLSKMNFIIVSETVQLKTTGVPLGVSFLKKETGPRK